MEQLLTNLFESVGGAFSYLLVFTILIRCGVGLPVPEDVSLILGGSLVFQGKAGLFLMMLTGYVGIILGDSLMFLLGRRFGSQVGVKKGGLLGRIITPAKRARVEELFKKHGEKVVMIARFIFLATTRRDAESPTEEMLRDPLFMANFAAFVIVTAAILYGWI